MSAVQLEMLLFLMLYGLCLALIWLVISRRNRGHKSNMDWVVVSASVLCIILGAALGMLLTMK